MCRITHFATGDGTRGFSGRLGCSATGRSSPFPGGGTGFLGGTRGAAGLTGFSGTALSTFHRKRPVNKITVRLTGVGGRNTIKKKTIQLRTAIARRCED